MKFEPEHKPLASFSFSSLTDIVLLLLIFFLLTSQFVINNGVTVNLPKTEHSAKANKTKIIVSLDAAGNIFFAGKKTNLEELENSLKKMEEAGEKSLILRADKDVTLEKVVRIIDVAKGCGIEKFTVQTEKQRSK